MKKVYVFTDCCSGYSFEMELTHEELGLIRELKCNLGYVMEDICIEDKDEIEEDEENE